MRPVGSGSSRRDLFPRWKQVLNGAAEVIRKLVRVLHRDRLVSISRDVRDVGVGEMRFSGDGRERHVGQFRRPCDAVARRAGLPQLE